MRWRYLDNLTELFLWAKDKTIDEESTRELDHNFGKLAFTDGTRATVVDGGGYDVCIAVYDDHGTMFSV